MGMIGKLLFSDRAPKIIKKSLDFNTQKAAVIAGNIANADTPGFKATRVEFESVLQQAASANTIKMKTTNEMHFQTQNQDLTSMKPNMETDPSPSRLDGNNVNLEKEMTNLAETRINYDAGITAMMKRGSIIKSAITDTR